jgi:energy-coupling factor transporter ATP-binding protein EcfA2
MPQLPYSPRQGRLPAGARQPAGRLPGEVTFTIINFKAIASAKLAPRRLTILAGANSSGKSSLLQALLFLTQSYPEATPVINGDLVRLGEPSDVIRNGADDLTIEFEYPDVTRRDEETPTSEKSLRTLRITLEEVKDTNELAVSEFAFWRDEQRLLHATRADTPKRLALWPEETLLRVENPEVLELPEDSYVTFVGVTPGRIVYRADLVMLRASFDQLLGTARDQRSFTFWAELSRMIRTTGGDKALLRRLQAAQERVEEDEPLEDLALSERDLETIFKAYADMEAPEGWVREPMAAHARRSWRIPAAAQGGDVAAQLLAQDLARGFDHVERLTRAVLYLGPLRDDPRVAYPLGHTVRTLPVGEKGELTAAYLQQNEHVKLRFTHPRGMVRRDTLSNAVSAWCEHLGIADRISVIATGKLGHQLGLRIAGTERDPTAIGVGASQLLPVVVLVLGAPVGAIVMLEQPELHLHPKVQARLADFFAFARPDIRLVIETHSEYLLTRLRLRVAEARLPQSDLSVLFASQRRSIDDSEHGAIHTEYRDLSIDELGDFDFWPEDFFDSLDADSVELAKAVTDRVRARRAPTEQ